MKHCHGPRARSLDVRQTRRSAAFVLFYLARAGSPGAETRAVQAHCEALRVSPLSMTA
jgi:hypothetical protein